MYVFKINSDNIKIFLTLEEFSSMTGFWIEIGPGEGVMCDKFKPKRPPRTSNMKMKTIAGSVVEQMAESKMMIKGWFGADLRSSSV